ncbi:proline-rich protein 14 [Gastrophryne carolinensis]
MGQYSPPPTNQGHAPYHPDSSTPPTGGSSSSQVAPCPRPAPDVRPPAGEEGAVGSSPGTERGRIEAPPLSPEASAHLPAAISPPITEGSSSSCPSPEPPPAKVPRWGLFPFLHSVRNKLESFADIFLSPIKSRPDSQHDLHSQPMTEQHHAYPAAEDRPSPGHQEAGLSPCSAPSGMNFQLKIAFCSPVPTLCRPPLQRCLSCPLLPRPPRRRSLEADPREAGCSYRKRRHSVGTVEEFRKIPLSPACLRKEKHPSALWAPRSPAGSDPACANSSPPGRYADEDQVTVASTCDAVEESMAHPGCKEMREGRVSTIQIRKRVTRQDGGLTPLGLPKRVRLHKDDFSLEEIYTNKNYHTPTEKRKFETIFEEPIMKGGALVLTGQRPLRRIMVFRDGGAPRRRRKKKGRGGGRSRRGGNSAAAQLNVELLLQHKLDELDEALQHLEEEELHKAVLV